jgi:hypothetical protein
MRKKQPVPFEQKFPNADPLALRLLERLLALDPKDRPTAEEVCFIALRHFYVCLNSCFSFATENMELSIILVHLAFASFIQYFLFILVKKNIVNALFFYVLVLYQALADPYFKGLSKVEREPSCLPITKMEFEFERRRVTKEDIRELIFREILEYHPQLLKDYMNGTERTNFLYPRF